MGPDTDDDLDEERPKGGARERFQAKLEGLSSTDDEADGDDGTDEPPVRFERNEDTGEDDPVVPLTRKEKKQERLRMRDENAQLRAESIQMRERLARLEGAHSAMSRQGEERDETDAQDDLDAALDQRLTELQDQHTAAWRQLQARGQNATQADKDAYAKTIRAIDKEKVRVTTEAIVAQRMAEVQATTQGEVIKAQIRQQYADVYGNPNAVQYAEGEYRKLVASGHKGGPDTLDRAMKEARHAFRMTREPPPSATQRARFAGPPRGRGGPGGAEPESIKMTPELRRMANAAFSHVPDQNKRYELWAKGPGKAMLAASKKGT